MHETGRLPDPDAVVAKVERLIKQLEIVEGGLKAILQRMDNLRDKNVISNNIYEYIVNGKELEE